ncbi:MAG: hypothetical protein A2Y56_12530 [Candidatus Aminicenantes bacterium RBG_13_63_10]|nr:MAG: hypothetical protein A2Y56_12530 [Candidatus Aminicenantes bacterium RBG_13_63_10]
MLSHASPFQTRRFPWVVAVVFALLVPGPASRAALGCTVAVVSGKATPDGRPLLWKNRDAADVDNRMMFFRGLKYAFVAVVSAREGEPEGVWAGLNAEGLAVMNSAASDLSTERRPGNGNGVFMKAALGECATVADFEAFLERTRGQYDLAADFGVIDAGGGACFFETSSDGYVKFDAADPRLAPFGYIVRTNYAFTSPDLLKGGGFIRFERVSRLFERARAENRLDLGFILREAARDLVNEKLHSHPLTAPLPSDPAFPLYVNTNDTLNRNSTVSVSVFHGAPSRERADLATMWVLLGQPVAGVAVPVWPAAGFVPTATAGEKTAPLCDFGRALISYLYPDPRGRMPGYLNVNRLRACGGEGVLPKLLRVESEVLSRAASALAGWEKAKPAPAAVAAFQEKLASWALDALRREFQDIKIP